MKIFSYIILTHMTKFDVENSIKNQILSQICDKLKEKDFFC
jgi:hypothetical protein